ncbi:ras and Rab interactor 3 [Channa argus]|uniref:ras and Rab interactor 3 n=1 Tax=Channa argus TaxID=215402 RepID=UPI0029471A01|nr:hypothetical protein Q8A73_017132 [Channa argus]
MMEASVASQDTGRTSPLTRPLNTQSNPSTSPLSPPPPSSNPPARPCRPKPPPPTSKSSQLRSRPPLPPCTNLSLPPPPLHPVSKPPLSSNPPPPSLPSPICPTVLSTSSLISPQPTVSADLPPSSIPHSLPPPLSPTVLSASSSSPTPPPLPVIPPFSPALPQPSPVDHLLGSTSIWQPKSFSQDQTTSILEKERAGVFLVHSTEDKGMMLSVRLPDEHGAPLVHNLMVKQYKTFVHLDGSSLVFDDIIKLISFYCVSRDILDVTLKLPLAITTATRREELEVISAMGADFWTDLNQQARNQDQVLDQNHSSPYLYVNPVTLEKTPSNDLNPSSSPTFDINTDPNLSSSLQNGEAPQKVSPEVKGHTKSTPSKDIKYKRPPPRPPSLGSGSGMGLLFSSPPSPHASSAVAPAAEKKEEGRGGGGEKEERKSMSTSPPQSRPPVPLQSRVAPPLPPAPLRRTSSRKSTDQEVGEGTEREKGHNPAQKSEIEQGGERGEEKTRNKAGLLCDVVEQEDSNQHREEEKEEVVKKDTEKKETEDEKEEKEVTMNKEEDKEIPSSQCEVKRPSRPVPPPRRKPPDMPVHPNQAGRVLASQSTGMTILHPSPPRRPDVSLYSPQGGAALGNEPDSCSTSSTEEEAETNLEQEQNHNRPVGSHSPRPAVRRTPTTTVMLDRARCRLSSVLTSLISHDRRLTQRVVELTRDPASYIGNLLKEHRAFTLETMSNHSSTTELLQEIRQMMTQLKSYLLQSAELQALLEPQHQYSQEKLEGIVEAALCKSVLKPLREPIYQSLERLHTNSSSLKQLAQNQSLVLGSTTTALGITTAVPEASAMEKISLKLNKLHLEYSPQKKIELLLKTCKIIYDAMSVSCPGRAHGADDFLPVMMYVLARSNLSALQLDVEYMMELMDPALTLGEGSYYLTTTYGAVEHIKTFDQQRSATRQLSREVQDSIHRWERRRTLNKDSTAQGSIRDFLTVCCPEVDANPKTLGVLPTTTIQQLSEQCAARFEQDSYTLSVYMDGVHRPVAPTELALSVKNSCQPGAYCFVYHPPDQLHDQHSRTCPIDPPPAPPAEAFFQADTAACFDAVEPEAAEESLISL